ncbi:hypothetical protein EC957_012079 [Mortierella hygrophila]|uniref:Ubiquitin carboxyl-terminal hydrolase n=1 Tax=Mortierella hygrophila TaxID=979708 RepID=A0A9P6F7W4_9FUNG|nr:hypothetical protein EC957_012079 [Mortierella hygrophila]
MDASARTLTASLILITTAALLARSFSHPSSSSSDGNPTTTTQTKTQRVKRNNKKWNQSSVDEPQYVAGLVNVGNTCFMNAVLQALASLPSLKEYLQDRNDIGHDPDSITQALYETIEMLNVIYRRPTSKRLVKMVNTVKAKAAHVLTSQQQDAQELFQILSSQLSEEREKVDHATTLSLSEILEPLSQLPHPPSSTERGARSTRQPSVSAVMASSLSSSTVFTLSSQNNQQLQGSPSATTPTIRVEIEPQERVSSNGIHDDEKEADISGLMTASVMLDRTEQEKYRRAKSPFMGLLASRVSCVDCGYTAAIRHSTFDNLSLTVPLQYTCSLEHCLDSFIHLDTISDFNCRKCTLLGASKDLGRKIEQGKRLQRQREEKELGQRQTDSATTTILPLESQQQGNCAEDSMAEAEQVSTQTPSPAKRRRSSRLLKSLDESSSEGKETSSKPGKISLVEMEQLKARVDYCLASDIEMDLTPIELTPVRSKSTTKHSMIAKPPQALCLHLNRSMFTSSGQMAKNPCKVVFESQLDFTRFTTSGHLTTVPTKSMSRRGSLSEAVSSSKSTLSINGRIPLSISGGFSGTFASGSMLSASSLSSSPMALSSPVSRTAGSAASNLIGGDGGEEDEDGERVMYRLWSVVVHLGSHNSGHFVTYRRIPSSNGEQPSKETSNDGKWWRISDEDVQIVEWTLVKNAEAYMLYYEKEL